MGSIKLHVEPITCTITNVTQTISQINANFVQSILTLVTMCCNSTKARYTGEERPRVKVTQRDIEFSFLWIKKNGRLVIYVPYSLRHELMTSAHGYLMVGHNGVKKCKEQITECTIWPDMDNLNDLQPIAL